MCVSFEGGVCGGMIQQNVIINMGWQPPWQQVKHFTTLTCLLIFLLDIIEKIFMPHETSLEWNVVGMGMCTPGADAIVFRPARNVKKKSRCSKYLTCFCFSVEIIN